MSSRVQEKAAARRHRQEIEADQRRADERRRGLRRLAVAAVAALAVVSAAVAFSRGDEESPAVAAPMTSSLTGLRQQGIAVGDPDAPATLVEFADLQCPFCGVYGREVLPTVLDRYVRTGKLRLELHVLAFLGEDSVRAGTVAAGAAAQDRLWSFTEAFFANQGAENSGYVTDAFLRSTTSTAGVDLAAAQRDPAARGVLERAERESERLGVKGTPAFFLRRGDGKPEPVAFGGMTAAAFTAALDEALAAR